MSSTWKAHLVISSVLAAVLVGFSVLVVLHPTLGFASQDSILAGADLRASLLAVCWIAFAAGILTATLGVALFGRLVQRPVVVVASSYAVALLSTAAALHLVDRFF